MGGQLITFKKTPELLKTIYKTAVNFLMISKRCFLFKISVINSNKINQKKIFLYKKMKLCWMNINLIKIQNILSKIDKQKSDWKEAFFKIKRK